MDQIYGKHFSIMDPQNVSTVIYQINRNDISNINLIYRT